MQLFQGAYTSAQNLVTLVILDGLAQFAYSFVVLFSSLSFTFPTFSDLPHFKSSFDVPSTLINKEVGKPTWHIVHVHTRNLLVRTNKRTDIRRKQHITTCKECILEMPRRSNNIISCLNLHSSCTMYQENDQSGWQKVRVFCCNL